MDITTEPPSLGHLSIKHGAQGNTFNLQSPILVSCRPPDQDWYAELCMRYMGQDETIYFWRHQRRELNLILNQCFHRHSPCRQWLVLKTDGRVNIPKNMLVKHWVENICFNPLWKHVINRCSFVRVLKENMNSNWCKPKRVHDRDMWSMGKRKLDFNPPFPFSISFNFVHNHERLDR